VVGGARSLEQVERAHVEAVLSETRWNITRASEILDVDRGTLYHKIQRWGLQKPAHAE
jgi:transcriptional regulator of acetoin/glycerol metabolism